MQVDETEKIEYSFKSGQTLKGFSFLLGMYGFTVVGSVLKTWLVVFNNSKRNIVFKDLYFAENTERKLETFVDGLMGIYPREGQTQS